MIKINLLPSDSIKKEDRKEIFAIACVIVGICVILGGVQYALKITAYTSLQKRTEKTQQELNKYENIVKQVETLQTTKQALETKKNIINTLMTRRLIYPQFMENLVMILPGNIWFKNLTTHYDGVDKLVCALSAESSDNYAIADLITAMATNIRFSGVEVGTISSQTGQKQPSSSFLLNFTYQEKKKNG